MSRYKPKITVIAVIVLTISIYGVLGYTQNSPVDVPIVSDEPAKPSDSLRVVGKDEQQRIVNELALKIQKLENRIAILEGQVNVLKEKHDVEE